MKRAENWYPWWQSVAASRPDLECERCERSSAVLYARGFYMQCPSCIANGQALSDSLRGQP